MSATDSMVARYAGEIDERQAFIDQLVERAEKENRDIDGKELELIGQTRDRISVVNGYLSPLREAAKIAAQSRETTAKIAAETAAARSPEMAQKVEYRSAGQYVIDRWRAGLGDNDAATRLDLYHRAAAHQTTADNAGLIPAPIIDPVINFVDSSRSLVTALGPRNMPGQTWSRPKVTQHTSVALQSAEKAELVSQKMLITKLTGTAATYGGYVNVSRQDVDFTQPGVMDIVISDLAAQYAIQTEAAASTAFATAATAGSTLPTGANTADQISGALWAAAAAIFTATKGAGRVFAVIPPGMLAAWGPLFPPVNPTNQQSAGFNGANFSTGLVGNIAGIPVYVSAAITSNTGLVLSSAAAEVYEDRIGSLQVVEPSVLGVQVAYAGYFTPMVVEATGIIKITKTP